MPIVWSGHILLIDSLIQRVQGKSLLSHRRRELLFLLCLSLIFWLAFEFYNYFIKNWHYIGLPRQQWARYLGYAWFFAAIAPAVLLMARLLEVLGFPRITVFPGAQDLRDAPGWVSRIFTLCIGMSCDLRLRNDSSPGAMAPGVGDLMLQKWRIG